ncbi:MAG TPA: hypothetical protein VK012_04715 [Gemmatimonadales bacterium]|nr:hypothetical protein [Gemmatimonadales bacterium]
MARRIIDVDGTEWQVSLSGRTTQYHRDEFGLVFARGSGPDRERRVSRYSPVGSKVREISLSQMTDGQLRRLFQYSQPAWTAPEMGYSR